jgi:hypothetical protein
MSGPIYTLKISGDEARLMIYLLRQAQMKGDSAIAKSLADKLEEATIGKKASKPQAVKKWLPGQTVPVKRYRTKIPPGR